MLDEGAGAGVLTGATGAAELEDTTELEDTLGCS